MPDFYMDVRFKLGVDNSEDARLMADDFEDLLVDVAGNTEPNIDAELAGTAKVSAEE